MKNKRGEVGVGEIMTVFVVILVGVVLFQAIAQEAGKTQTLSAFINTTITPGVDGTVHSFTDYRQLSGVGIVNSSGQTIDASNYTVANDQVINGNLVATITVAIGNTGTENITAWNVTATSAMPLTYIPESGGRAIANLIAIFFALAVAIVALTPTLRSGVLNMIN